MKHLNLLALTLFVPLFAKAGISSESVAALASKCSPDVSPLTMSYIVKLESGNNPYSININRNAALEHQPSSEAEAITVAKKLISENKNIDLGLAQINSKNLKGLGLTVEEIFKPCVNLAASQTILKACYHESVKSWQPGQDALKHTLSCYNTGSQTRGFSTGYVQKVERIASSSHLKIPALLPDTATAVDAEETKAESYDGEKDAFSDVNATNSQDAFSRKNTDAFISRTVEPGNE